MKGSSEIPKDAIPEVHVPSVIESFFGGPIVTRTKFLPPDRVVQTLQMSAAIILTLLCIVTFTVTPVSGTAWFWLSDLMEIPIIGSSNSSLLLIGIGFHWRNVWCISKRPTCNIDILCSSNISYNSICGK